MVGKYLFDGMFIVCVCDDDDYGAGGGKADRKETLVLYIVYCYETVNETFPMMRVAAFRVHVAYQSAGQSSQPARADFCECQGKWQSCLLCRLLGTTFFCFSSSQDVTQYQQRWKQILALVQLI